MGTFFTPLWFRLSSITNMQATSKYYRHVCEQGHNILYYELGIRSL